MRKLYYSILLIFGLILTCGLQAQNTTSSPYSRSAYGDLNDNVANTFRAMGGVGVGMRNNKVICPAQPASITAGDSLTFMFDLAASVMWSNYTDAGGHKNKAGGNLEYLTMQFPLYKRYVAFSAGLLPYSAVGYDIELRDSLNSDYHFTKSYTGDGGISEVFLGLGVNVVDWLALGANFYYMFGDIDNVRAVTFDEAGLNQTFQYSSLHVGSVRMRYGAQLFHTFGDHSFVLGGIFENKQKLKSSYVIYESITLDSVYSSVDDDNYRTELPMQYGVGASYTWADRLTVGFDFMHQGYANTKYILSEGNMRDRNRYALGAEYRHNPQGRKYVERVMWRVGCNVADPYVTNVPGMDWSLSLGVGLPLRNVGTIFNATVEYAHRGSKGFLEENSLRLTINAAIAENWFFKRKL